MDADRAMGRPATHLGRTWTIGEWMRIGAFGWLAVTVLYVVVWGFRRSTFGLPFYESWAQVGTNAGTFAVGALLSPFIVLALRRLHRAAAGAATRIAGYVALGLVYWCAWSLIVAVLLPPPGVTSLAEGFVRVLVLGALVILTIHAVIVMLFEAHRSLRDAQRAEAEVDALRAELSAAEAEELKARLNPALVFDSLTVASRLVASDPRAARKVIADLGELLRVSLGRDGARLIRLEEEVELLHRYLEIRTAGGKRATALQEDLDAEVTGWTVAPLVLVRLVDGALRTSDEAGTFELFLGGRRAGSDLLRVTIDLRQDAGFRGTECTGNAQAAHAQLRLQSAVGDAASVESVSVHCDGIRLEVLLPWLDHTLAGGEVIRA